MQKINKYDAYKCFYFKNISCKQFHIWSFLFNKLFYIYLKNFNFLLSFLMLQILKGKKINSILQNFEDDWVTHSVQTPHSG